MKTQNKSKEYARIGTVLSPEEIAAAQQLAAKLKDSPVPDREIIAHLGAYLDKSALGHILFIHEPCTLILNVHGVIIEMGVRWGRNWRCSELRNLYEPRIPTRG